MSGKIIRATSSERLDLPSYEQLKRLVQIPLEMVEEVEEIFLLSGADPIERWQLEWILRAAIYVDRSLPNEGVEGK